jgi:hypothetical protein
LTHPRERSAAADTALRVAARSWFAVTVLGQVIFAFAVGSFYSLTALRGNYLRWSKFITHGHVPGDTVGNLAIALHVASAVIVLLSGALQIVPSVRGRFPVFHRWNGRFYLLGAVTLGAAGLYMQWVRGSIGDVSQSLGSTLNAVVIWLCAGMALRTALARDFRTHRRWALRLFLVASGAYFFRLGVFLSLMIFRGPVGFDPTTFRGPFLTFMAYAQFLLPLAVLELYLLAKERAGDLRRMATATLLFVLTLGTGIGLFGVSMVVWVPDVQAAFDSRPSIAETLAVTLSSRGVEPALLQYRRLKTERPERYNFDESELNLLGHQLLDRKQVREAIRIFQLNLEAFPKSSRANASLAEAYRDDANWGQAVAHYRKAVELNPKNLVAAISLRKLNTFPAEGR